MTEPAEDPIATLEEAIDFLLKIMAASISYLTRKAPHIQLHPEIPLAALSEKAAENLVDEETMVESAEELVQDLMLKAKEVELLINALPPWTNEVTADTPAEAEELEALQAEMRTANSEYRAAAEEARELQKQVSELLLQVCEDQQRARVAYAKAIVLTNGS